jgi:hypothetical protein
MPLMDVGILVAKKRGHRPLIQDFANFKWVILRVCYF